eukprot:TRINITY_DN59795_c0_g1_i1.p1 TRINITY_DN59795_c0_g1~~TRINITY_DN59795_c0_g1_i1.p1  ORF type:complete len:298 (+),score=39.57 TRINITY_DN59795_c0_g1_i1:59-952(+)
MLPSSAVVRSLAAAFGLTLGAWKLCDEGLLSETATFLAAGLSVKPGWDGRCGDCFCIPSDDGLGMCPDFRPETNFSSAVIEELKSKKLVNPFSDLNCNPYKDAECETQPPQQLVDTKTAVCAFKYHDSRKESYELRTYLSAEAAKGDGALVTHTGSCGLCSTAQDLAVYMKIPDMTSAGKKCASKSLFVPSWGKRCYEELGYTEGCASIWQYDGLYDAKHCLGVCLKNIFAHQANNGPPPSCSLNPCLACDETAAGPLFKRFAGRTRRRSGLTSHIARGCEDFAFLYPTSVLGGGDR